MHCHALQPRGSPTKNCKRELVNSSSRYEVFYRLNMKNENIINKFILVYTMNKLVKDVNPKSWHEIKMEATKHGMKIGEFLSFLIKEYKKREKKSAWHYIFNAKKRLTDKEAEAIKKSIHKDFETEYDFEW